MPIRVRLAVLFALATLALMGAGGYVFVTSLEKELETTLDTSLRTRAQALVQRAKDPQSNLQASGPTRLIQSEDTVAQIIDPSGRVIESSAEAGTRPLVSRKLQHAAQSRSRFTIVSVDRERLRALATTVRRPEGSWTTIVASSLESGDAAVSRVIHALVIGGAIAVALAGTGGWLLAAAALHPVERMRREAAEISEHDATSRLPVPTTRDEIAALASTMNDLLARLQGALVRQRAFVADAGHELRTPLAVLRTELELAARPHRSREDLMSAIRSAADETDRLARLSDQLLFLARGDERDAVARFETEPLMPLLDHSVEAFQPVAARRNVTLTLSVENGVLARVDAADIRRAVDNLVDNALRFAPADTEVTVEGRRDGPDIVISVVDHGPGFPEDFLPHAFERFRRADDSRTRTEGGTGLGLAIVSAVAREHGGTASASNRAGGGGVVQLRIPAASASAN
jgi:heavy metal sensor kinase